ncbi:MAG TPA: CapA family protein [Clostridiales bacterium]|nr:CapA family protein [Clostridiales bacterium]
MKKKNILLLSIGGLVSLVLLCSLLVYAFRLQNKQDEIDEINNNNSIELADSNSDDLQDREDTPDTDKEAEEVPQETPLDNSHLETDEDPDYELSPHDNEDDINDEADNLDHPIILAFAGDINLDENSKPVAKYDREKKGILGGISEELVSEMNDADIMMLNNEFAYSTRGTKTPDKSYTFRANPDRVDILKEMGVDIVSLANNHALDYGPDALMDTFTTLDNAGIDYVGAGENLDRAKAPIYYEIGDKKIAYLASSRVIFAMDWYATEDRPGMVGTYDPAQLLESIKEASANSDYVVVYVHWGVERNHYPEKYQKSFARAYIDAGADIVIGCHPHVMQGFEIYKGKPIAYSLGNYWFNSSKRESSLLKVFLDPNGSLRTQLLPVMNNNTYTYLITDEKSKKDYYDFMEEISFDVSFDEDGFIYQD